MNVERVVEQAQAICAVPAPPFAEAARGAFVAELLAAEGAAVEQDSTGNVLARLGPATGETIVLAAHLDTVFAAGTEIVFRREGERLSAPGIGDNSLGVAALVHLARHFRGAELRRPVMLAATVGEEGLGDLRGAKALVAEQPCAMFVALEGQGRERLVVQALGSIRLRVVARGPGGHPWGDRGRPSAIHVLLPRLAAVVECASAAELVVNVGTIAGGTTINAIAGEARAEIDLRGADETRLSEIAQEASDLLGAPAPLAIEVERIGHRPGGAIAADHELLRAARRARERAGLPPAEEGASSTDANAAHGRGIPAICVGVSTGGNAHRLDEYIDLPPIRDGLAMLEALVEELALARSAGA